MKTTYPIDNYNFAGKRVVIRVDFNVPLDARLPAISGLNFVL